MSTVDDELRVRVHDLAGYLARRGLVRGVTATVTMPPGITRLAVLLALARNGVRVEPGASARFHLTSRPSPLPEYTDEPEIHIAESESPHHDQ
ncbi:hypothetical protein ACTOWY_40105 [Crossiella sp. CA198]